MLEDMSGDENYPYKAKERVEALISSLKATVRQDPNHRISPQLLPVLDAILSSISDDVPNDPVVRAITESFFAISVSQRSEYLAADVLLMAEQLDAAIGDRPIGIA